MKLKLNLKNIKPLKIIIFISGQKRRGRIESSGDRFRDCRPRSVARDAGGCRLLHRQGETLHSPRGPEGSPGHQ